MTGIPRSGTTLACELLNQLPETVALDEPIEMGAAGDSHDPQIFCDLIERFIEESRSSIVAGSTAMSKQRRVVESKGADERDGDRLRTLLAKRKEISIDKPASSDFLLVVKHPVMFTVVLDRLVERFPVYAVVRNPLSILSSWQTVPFLVRNGHLRNVAERLDRELRTTLARLDDRFERQLHLLGWFFEKYRTTLPKDRVIRYESIVESRGQALSAITQRAATLDEPLESRNRAAVYDADVVRELGERLLEIEGPYWHFYTKDSVRELLP